MPAADSYYLGLRDAADEIERIYGIRQVISEGNSDISSIIRYVNPQVGSLGKEEIADRNIEAGKQIVLVSYLCFRFEFFRISRMDFNPFPAVDEIGRILGLFVYRDNYVNTNMKLINRIIKCMSKVDEKSTKVRYGLSYRYLRIFIILVMFNSSCNASIVANLLLQQMTLQNELERRSRERA